MCGRYSLIHSASAIAERFSLEKLPEMEPRYNAAPTDRMPVIRQGGEAREIARLRWGLVPFWAKDEKVGYRMINARSETVATKPSFRQAFQRRRCLVPFDGFYEWVEKGGRKWPIRIIFGEEEELQAFAGLWELWTGPEGETLESFTILTTAANPVLEEIHDRMPVVVPEPFWDRWIGENEEPQEVLEEILEAFPAAKVGFGPVSREINRAGVEKPELIEPSEEPDLPRREPKREG